MIEDLLLDKLFPDDHQFVLEYRGHAIVVAVESSSLVAATVRLFVDGRLVSTKRAFSSVRVPAELPGQHHRHRIEVKVSLDLLGAVKSCHLIDDSGAHPMPRSTGRCGTHP